MKMILNNFNYCLAILCSLILYGCTSSSLSGSITENLQFNLPENFKNIGGHTEKDGVYVRTYTNMNDPTEKIAHYFFSGSNKDVLDVYQNILPRRNYADCNQKTLEMSPKHIKTGEYDLLNAGVDCQQNRKGKASFAHYSIVKGAKGIYILERIKTLPINFQRPLHGEGLSPQLRQDWIAFFESAYLCTYYPRNKDKCVKI